MKEVRAKGPYYTAWIGDALVGYGPSPQVMRVRDIVVVRWHDTDGDMSDAAGDAGKAEPA